MRDHGPLRSRCPQPTLADAEVLAVEIVGALLGTATYGRHEGARQTFYGFRAHGRVEWPGVIVACDLAPGNVSDVAMTGEVSDGAERGLLGHRNYRSPTTRDALAMRGLDLMAPFKLKRHDPAPWPWWLTQIRRRIETVLGQLAEALRAKRVWARDRWPLTSRWYRRLCARTLGVVLGQAEGLSPLRFSELIADSNPHTAFAQSSQMTSPRSGV